MKNKAGKTRRPSLATVMAALALFIAIGGTATAAGLINGKNIKKGTVTAKQIKNKTITTGKLAPSTVSALKGAKGEKGERGEKGEQGIQGVQGIPGVDAPIATFSDTTTDNNQPANTETSLTNFNGLPGKRYLAIATVEVFSNGTSTVSCGISASNGGGTATATWSSPVNGSRTTLPLQLATSVATNHIELTCNPGNSIGSFDSSMILVPLS